MKNNNPVIHGPFHDVINYRALIEQDSKRVVTRISFPKDGNKTNGQQKIKKRKNNR